MEALSKALERRRVQYNALFAEAQQRNSELQATDLFEHLRRRVAPIFDALPPLSDEAADRVLEALYRASLELLSRRLLGSSGTGTCSQVWEQLLPRLGALLAIAPRRIVAALSNAAFNLDQTPSARPAEWLQRMLAISEHCQDIETLMRAGQVAAWRSGLPHYRASALAHCPTLPPAALALALRANDTTQTTDANALLAQLSQKRFAGASAPVLSIVGRLGGFTGYGGQFCAPPQLVRSAGALFAFDSNAVWELHADAFGSLLRRLESSTPPAADAPSKAFTLSATGRVQWAGGAHDFAEFAGATAWVCDDELLAVVPSRSHYIYLVAAQSGPTC